MIQSSQDDDSFFKWLDADVWTPRVAEMDYRETFGRLGGFPNIHVGVHKLRGAIEVYLLVAEKNDAKWIAGYGHHEGLWFAMDKLGWVVAQQLDLTKDDKDEIVSRLHSLAERCDLI